MNRIKLAVMTVGGAAMLSVGVVSVGSGVASAAGKTTIDLSSFAYELCGDTAFSDESDGVKVEITYAPGTGPFGGGTYDCSTGELTF